MGFCAQDSFLCFNTRQPKVPPAAEEGAGSGKVNPSQVPSRTGGLPRRVGSGSPESRPQAAPEGVSRALGTRPDPEWRQELDVAKPDPSPRLAVLVLTSTVLCVAPIASRFEPFLRRRRAPVFCLDSPARAPPRVSPLDSGHWCRLRAGAGRGPRPFGRGRESPGLRTSEAGTVGESPDWAGLGGGGAGRSEEGRGKEGKSRGEAEGPTQGRRRQTS